MKHCPRCNQDLPLSEFGVMRARPDGLNLYDKKCIREKIKAQRERRKAFRAIHRKPCERSAAVWRRRMPARDKIRLAFERGITDRKEIKRVTRLHWDAISDIIAELNDLGEIKWDRSAQVFRLAA